MELFRGMLPEERVMLTNPLKDKIHKGDPVFGTLLPVPSPEVVEILGLAGYDFLMLDMEHGPITVRSEEHTSELQSRLHLVCRLLLEKKKNKEIYELTSLGIRQIY